MGCCPIATVPASVLPGIRLWYNQGRKLGPHPWVVRLTNEKGQEIVVTVASWIAMKSAPCESMFDERAVPAAVVYFPGACYIDDPVKPGGIIIKREE